MKTVLRLEELGMFGLSIYWFTLTDFAWWWYPALILAPDIGMLGYLAGPKIGGVAYNLFHHKGLAVAVLLLGWRLDLPWVELSGIILFGHASLDRVAGYGLKYLDHFRHTHLGWLPEPKHKQ